MIAPFSPFPISVIWPRILPWLLSLVVWVGWNFTSPAIASPASWETITGEAVALDLPADYVGGNPQRDFPELEAQLATVEQTLVERLQFVRQNVGNIALLAFQNPGNQPYVTNVTVVKDRWTVGQSLEDYAATTAGLVSPPLNVLAQDIDTMGPQNRPFGRLETTLTGAIAHQGAPLDLHQLIYLLPDETNPEDPCLWVITYSTTQALYGEQQGDFVKSFGSFQGNPS